MLVLALIILLCNSSSRLRLRLHNIYKAAEKRLPTDHISLSAHSNKERIIVLAQELRSSVAYPEAQ